MGSSSPRSGRCDRQVRDEPRRAARQRAAGGPQRRALPAGHPASVLGQSMPDFEIIAVDDASTDTTPQLLRAPADPRLRYSRNEQNLGQDAIPPTAGWPRVARRWWRASTATTSANPIDWNSSSAISKPGQSSVGCGTWTIEIDPEDRVIGQQEPPDDPAHVRWSLCHTNRLYHPSMMLRRDALLQAGGYDERFPASEDYEMWTRLNRRRCQHWRRAAVV
ncbi:glycosyltransferase [Oscillatoria amoena NRMC-F 0135]|nr:glycosyltransferase [Oscillatoria amoena NRMC-F 0135]